MPRLIKHIDKIAREKNRAALFCSFESADTERRSVMKAPNHQHREWETDVNRQELIEWLEGNGINWEACGHFASESGWMAYGGNIYIDVPWDETDAQFVKVQAHLENSDGTPKNPQIKFWVVSLEEAMTNAHHDEPGFWEKWAETF